VRSAPCVSAWCGAEALIAETNCTTLWSKSRVSLGPVLGNNPSTVGPDLAGVPSARRNHFIT
jgi:hypothetical protein